MIGHPLWAISLHKQCGTYHLIMPAALGLCAYRKRSFAVCWIHQVCGEKFCNFFYHHLHTFMVFQLYKTATSVSMKASRSSREFSLKLSLARDRSLAHWEMDENTVLHYWNMCTCRFHAFQQSQEKSYGWKMKQITNRSSLLASFFCKLPPYLLAETL